MIRNSYCTGAAGIEAAEAATDLMKTNIARKAATEGQYLVFFLFFILYIFIYLFWLLLLLFFDRQKEHAVTVYIETSQNTPQTKKVHTNKQTKQS